MVGIICGARFHSTMVSDAEEEVFLSLEEDSGLKAPPVAKKGTTRSKKGLAAAPTLEPSEPVLEAEVLDATIVDQVTGNFEVSWPLLGMDCPDCASKAIRALKTLPQAGDVLVSATAGTVRLNIDLEQGNAAEVSSVLRSLGHAPNLEFNEIVGAKATAVAARNGVDRRKLTKVLRQQPGVLDVEVSEDDRIILQLVPDATKELFEKRNKALEHITGSPVTFVTAQSNRLRPDQWRLIGGGIALPLLVLVIVGELLGWSHTCLLYTSPSPRD